MEKNTNSVLQMVDFYFSSISFKQKKDYLGELKLNIFHNIEHQKNTENDSMFRVIITTSVKDQEGYLDLEVVSTGVFQITDPEIDESLKHSLVELNTVAIMFPYIRSEVSIITAQPGLMPILIPVVDVNKLVRTDN